MTHAVSRLIMALLIATVAPAVVSAQETRPQNPVPPVTEADRIAAFPPGLDGHDMGAHGWRYMVLFDQLEWRGRARGGLGLENTTWIGGDINRVWIRLDGESEDGRVEHAAGEVLWGHSVSRWWDVVAGVRHDRPGPHARTWVAFGLQGLAPQWFEVEATAYIGEQARTRLRLEVEYDLLLTNRLILQPVLEADIHSKDDPARHIDAGVSFNSGVRLRWVIKPELAPYVGVTHEAGRTRVAVGLRTWF